MFQGFYFYGCEIIKWFYKDFFRFFLFKNYSFKKVEIIYCSSKNVYVVIFCFYIF